MVGGTVLNIMQKSKRQTTRWMHESPNVPQFADKCPPKNCILKQRKTATKTIKMMPPHISAIYTHQKLLNSTKVQTVIQNKCAYAYTPTHTSFPFTQPQSYQPLVAETESKLRVVKSQSYSVTITNWRVEPSRILTAYSLLLFTKLKQCFLYVSQRIPNAYTYLHLISSQLGYFKFLFINR